MVVKKLYRRVKSRWWNAERKVFENTTTTDYIGWFLFGFIPVYLIELDRHEDVNFEDGEECSLTYEINRKYEYLITKN